MSMRGVCPRITNNNTIVLRAGQTRAYTYKESDKGIVKCLVRSFEIKQTTGQMYTLITSTL